MTVAGGTFAILQGAGATGLIATIGLGGVGLLLLGGAVFAGIHFLT